MFYEWAISIPPAKTKTDPVKVKLNLKKGVITQWSVKIPAGHHALACLTIWDGERQIVPENPDSRIRGDDESLPIPFFFRIGEEFYTLEARGWNDDPTNTHTFYLRCSDLPEYVALPYLALGKTLEQLLSLWRRLTGLGR